MRIGYFLFCLMSLSAALAAASSIDFNCATGCSIGNHPITPLTNEEVEILVAEFGGGNKNSLDELLFHGRESRGYLASATLDKLDPMSADLLKSELARTHVRLWLRLVNDDGVVRAKVDGLRLPIGEKSHVMVTDTKDLPSPELSGTIHRTGLQHLWTRI